MNFWAFIVEAVFYFLGKLPGLFFAHWSLAVSLMAALSNLFLPLPWERLLALLVVVLFAALWGGANKFTLFG